VLRTPDGCSLAEPVTYPSGTLHLPHTRPPVRLRAATWPSRS